MCKKGFRAQKNFDNRTKRRLFNYLDSYWIGGKTEIAYINGRLNSPKYENLIETKLSTFGEQQWIFQ